MHLFCTFFFLNVAKVEQTNLHPRARVKYIYATDMMNKFWSGFSGFINIVYIYVVCRKLPSVEQFPAE